MEKKLNAAVTVTRMQAGRFSEVPDQLAVEEPLQIQLLYGPSGKEQEKNLAVTMRTPGNDEELAAGFLYTEGIIRNKSNLIRIIAGASGDNTVLAILDSSFIPMLSGVDRNFYVSSSCGVCGKSSIEAVRKVAQLPPTEKPLSVTVEMLLHLPATLRNEQLIFQRTGGLHASALFNAEGNFLLLREDVGRHNALDKIIGAALLNGQLPLDETILLLSGRASFELIQKAAAAGIRVVAAIGAPSSLAVELAREAGITLIGFLKPDRFNIYTGAERVIAERVINMNR